MIVFVFENVTVFYVFVAGGIFFFRGKSETIKTQSRDQRQNARPMTNTVLTRDSPSGREVNGIDSSYIHYYQLLQHFLQSPPLLFWGLSST